jgi:tight adherence protein B
MDLLIASAVFLLFAGVGATMARRSLERAAVAHRLDEVIHSGKVADPLARVGPPSRAAAGLFEHLPRVNLTLSLQRQMWQAGMYQSVEQILTLIGAMGAGGAILAYLITKDLLIAVLVASGLAASPLLYIRLKRNRRLKAFLNQLPFALDLLKSSLEAGHTLQRGMQVVEQEFTEPLGGEFRTVVEQMRLGTPVSQALAEMLHRVPLDDLRLFVVAVKVQVEVGSSLAQILARLCEIVRTRQTLHSQIRALTAQSRMSGMVVGLLPVVVLAMFWIIQPSYTAMLFTDHTGKLILKTAIGLDFGAFLIIRRILRVNF